MLDRFIDMLCSNSDKDSEPTISLGRRAVVICICCNVFLCISKGITGFLFGSISLVADALNNLSDASANILELGGFYLAARPADQHHPYGHGRYEYLTGLGVAVIICGIGINLVANSIHKILNPAQTEFGPLLVFVLLLSIVVKLCMAAFLSRCAQRVMSQTLKAASLDSKYDVICSLVILIAASIGNYTGIMLDGIMGAAVGLYICIGGISLILEAVNPLLGEAPTTEEVEHIRQKILSYPGILGTHDLMVHDYGLRRRFASAHVEMAGEKNPFINHEIIDTIEQDFLIDEHMVMTLHYDPIVTDDPQAHDIRNRIDRAVKTIDPKLSVHDIRRVKKKDSEKIVFDCVLPDNYAGSTTELRKKITEAVRQQYPKFDVAITFDRGFLSASH